MFLIIFRDFLAAISNVSVILNHLQNRDWQTNTSQRSHHTEQEWRYSVRCVMFLTWQFSVIHSQEHQRTGFTKTTELLRCPTPTVDAFCWIRTVVPNKACRHSSFWLLLRPFSSSSLHCRTTFASSAPASPQLLAAGIPARFRQGWARVTSMRSEWKPEYSNVTVILNHPVHVQYSNNSLIRKIYDVNNYPSNYDSSQLQQLWYQTKLLSGAVFGDRVEFSRYSLFLVIVRQTAACVCWFCSFWETVANWRSKDVLRLHAWLKILYSDCWTCFRTISAENIFDSQKKFVHLLKNLDNFFLLPFLGPFGL